MGDFLWVLVVCILRFVAWIDLVRSGRCVCDV